MTITLRSLYERKIINQMDISIINYLERQQERLYGHQKLDEWSGTTFAYLDQYFEENSSWITAFNKIREAYSSSESEIPIPVYKIQFYNLLGDLSKFLRSEKSQADVSL